MCFLTLWVLASGFEEGSTGREKPKGSGVFTRTDALASEPTSNKTQTNVDSP